VTGHLNPIYELAEMAHEYRTQIMVDAAQLVPHHPFDMKPADHPQHIDYLAFSGHKIYAPFGSGVLIGPRETFLKGSPEYPGGGTVRIVTNQEIFWAELPDREEAGSPNVIGAFALAQTIKYLQKMNMQKMTEYEDDLTRYAFEEIRKLPGVKIYGSFPRVGVIAFNLTGITHSLLGSILCYEAGIGLRTGCFCAQPYVRKLLGIDEEQEKVSTYLKQNPALLPGMVRISLAAYNTRKEVEQLIKFLKSIISNKEQYKRDYKFSELAGNYIPKKLSKDLISNPFIINTKFTLERNS
ncbi:MAG: aminotransferase class V-fold PLP-dependent enzyme, partial [Syntrophomonadaceae bacterium]|nr:aminotransferase class V-fold PLP-dependent enzyme [Syntrophomonadaceae bacterium]